MSDLLSVAVLGTGIMGAPMARNLCRAGLDVRVWNRTRAKAEPLAEAGARVAGSPRDAVEGADVVLTMLHDGPATAETVRAAAPGLRSGTAWLQCTTAGLDGLPPLAALAGEYGLTFVDAPVLGTRQPAEAGQLLVLAAGPHEARPGIEPVLDAIGSRTVWVGEEAGAATRLKLVCNSWVLAVTHGTVEALSLADGLGVDPQGFLDAVEGGALDMGYLRIKADVIRSGDFTPSFAVGTAEKDARLIVAAAEEAGLRLDVAAAGAERFRRAAGLGHGGEDMAASYFASFPDGKEKRSKGS
ncbi:3-hydroxyisobutyrate dehydrogenase [Streptomyces abyssalis]|uniref:3-hydroxyisobutyrate dehydrogenase n=1 Tax=Streptomyces abyssalis TaxID=933944 RepID=A0A1E7JKB6_9ACTN|nr:NAD(P)-dependent oxidoreductase [Streptomyces abyssalis]OEU88062.1 3-hydroxyisobutyrate dehydrogenase [Streptomyces abyssalis]OEU90931.1 3-hydroxyisobutyrate dehydrogenase [Streptomyces abyssalis]OEV06164.1 3-hydroxyisobutyrate dehydrogenase [Streptomyces nanshensis]